MNRPILYGIFSITVGGSGVGTKNIAQGIRAGAFVTAITAPTNASYGFAVQTVSGANVFIKKNLIQNQSFSDLYAITSNGKFVIVGTPGTYSLEVWIFDDENLS